MDNRSITITSKTISLSGGNESFPLDIQYLIDNSTAGTDYSINSNFIDEVAILKSVNVEGYFLEENYNFTLPNDDTLQFLATCTAVILRGGIRCTIRNNFEIRAIETTLVEVSNFSLFIREPSGVIASIGITINIDSAMTGSFFRNVYVIAEDLSSTSVVVRYNFGTENYSMNVFNVDLIPNDQNAIGSIEIEGASDNTYQNGDVFVRAISSAGDFVFRNISIRTVGDMSRAVFRNFNSESKSILIAPKYLGDMSDERLHPVMGNLEVRRLLAITLIDSSTDGFLTDAIARIFSGDHVFHTGSSVSLTGLDTFILSGVYTVDEGGTNRVSNESGVVRIRKYGYESFEQNIVLNENDTTFIRQSIDPDETITNDEGDLNMTSVISIDFTDMTIGLVDIGNDNIIRPYDFYDYYKQALSTSANMQYEDMLKGSGRRFILENSSDWTVNINQSVVHENESDLGYILESEGDIVITQSVQCSLMVKYTRSSVNYSSILLRIFNLDNAANFTHHIVNVRYRATDVVNQTSTYSIISAQQMPHRIDNIGLIEFPLTDIVGSPNQELIINYIDINTYLTSVTLETPEVEGTIQTLVTQQIPGFVGLTFEDFQNNYTNLTSVENWTWNTAFDTHTLTIPNAGTITWRNIAMFLQFYMIINGHEFSGFTSSPFTFDGTVLYYPNIQYITNGNTRIDDESILSIYDSLSGTNLHSNNVAGTARITIENPEITQFKIKVIDTSDNSTSLDYTDITGNTYAAFIDSSIDARAVIYAEGYRPVTIDFNTNTVIKTFLTLEKEIDIDYTADIGVLDLEDSSTIITIAVTASLFTVSIEPTDDTDYIIDREDVKTFFGKLKAHEDYLDHLLLNDLNDIITIERTQVTSTANFDIKRVGNSNNLASQIKFFTFFESELMNYNASDSNNKIIEFESTNQAVDFLDLSSAFNQKEYLTLPTFITIIDEGSDDG